MSKKDQLTKDLIAVLLKEFNHRHLDINKIIVFGSYIGKRRHKNSDIDVIIISRDFRAKDIFEKASLTSGIGWELVRKLKKPFDILYYSDQEWKKGNSLIINTAKQDGIVIYG